MLVLNASSAASNVDLATGYLPSESDLPGSVSVGISLDEKTPDQTQPKTNPEAVCLQSLYPSLTKNVKVPVVPDEVSKKVMQEAETLLKTFEFNKLLCYEKSQNPLRGAKPVDEASLFTNTLRDINLAKEAIAGSIQTIIQPGCLKPRTAFRASFTSTVIFGAATIATLFVPEQTLGITASTNGGVVAGFVIARIASVVLAAIGPIFQARNNAIASDARREQDVQEKKLEKKLAAMRALIKTQRLGFKALGKELIQEWVRVTPGHGNERQRNKIIDQRIFTKEDLYSKEASKIVLLKAVAESWKNSLTELDRYFTTLTGSPEDAARILKPLDEAISAIQFDADKSAASADPLNKERIAMANNPMHTYLVRLRTETKEWLRERIETMITERAEKKQKEPFFHYKKQGSHLLEDGHSSADGQSVASDSRRRTLATGGLHASGSALTSQSGLSKRSPSPKVPTATEKNASRRASQTGTGGQSHTSATGVVQKLDAVAE